jgi:colanic acid/amylovoran biosynthesis protein
MHSNIFALTLGLPTVAISYDPKTDGIMAALGLSEYVIAASALDRNALSQAVVKVLADLDYKRRLSAGVERMQSAALNAWPQVQIQRLL